MNFVLLVTKACNTHTLKDFGSFSSDRQPKLWPYMYVWVSTVQRVRPFFEFGWIGVRRPGSDPVLRCAEPNVAGPVGAEISSGIEAENPLTACQRSCQLPPKYRRHIETTGYPAVLHGRESCNRLGWWKTHARPLTGRPCSSRRGAVPRGLWARAGPAP